MSKLKLLRLPPMPNNRHIISGESASQLGSILFCTEQKAYYFDFDRHNIAKLLKCQLLSKNGTFAPAACDCHCIRRPYLQWKNLSHACFQRVPRRKLLALATKQPSVPSVNSVEGSNLWHLQAKKTAEFNLYVLLLLYNPWPFFKLP